MNFTQKYELVKIANDLDSLYTRLRILALETADQSVGEDLHSAQRDIETALEALRDAHATCENDEAREVREVDESARCFS